RQPAGDGHADVRARGVRWPEWQRLSVGKVRAGETTVVDDLRVRPRAFSTDGPSLTRRNRGFGFDASSPAAPEVPIDLTRAVVVDAANEILEVLAEVCQRCRGIQHGGAEVSPDLPAAT